MADRSDYPSDLPASCLGGWHVFPSRAVWAEMCQVVSRPPSFKNIRGSKMQTDKARNKIGTGWPIKLLVFLIFLSCLGVVCRIKAKDIVKIYFRSTG